MGRGLDFFRDARWLNSERVQGYLRLLALLNLVTLVLLLVTSQNGVDRNGFLIGTDFLSFWTTGRMLHAGADVYEVASHIATQREFFMREGSFTAFFYPPSFLLFCYPLGLLPYFPALGMWLLATGAAYLAVVRKWLLEARVSQPSWLLFVAFPPVLITVTHGQTSFLVAALLGLGALLVPERAVLAGVCFGLATIKPQFGLLIPVVLIVTGEWRVIASASITAMLLALADAVAFGPDIWADWLTISGAAQSAMDQGSVGYSKMQSTLAAAMLLGAPAGLAYALQATVSLSVVATVVWAGWRSRYTLGLAALMLAGALLVTPFVLDYDMVLLAFPLIWLVSGGFVPWERFVSLASFVAPAFARPLAVEFGVPIMPFVLLALFAVLARRVLQERSGSLRTA